MSPPFFGDACWQALGAGSCPDLTVLWVDACGPPASYGSSSLIGRTLAAPSVARAALTALSPQLKLCMINPDNELESRYVPGRVDHLEGSEPVPFDSDW